MPTQFSSSNHVILFKTTYKQNFREYKASQVHIITEYGKQSSYNILYTAAGPCLPPNKGLWTPSITYQIFKSPISKLLFFIPQAKSGVPAKKQIVLVFFFPHCTTRFLQVPSELGDNTYIQMLLIKRTNNRKVLFNLPGYLQDEQQHCIPCHHPKLLCNSQ